MIFTNLTQTLGAIDAEVAELELFEQQRMELKTGREFFKQLLCPIQGDRSWGAREVIREWRGICSRDGESMAEQVNEAMHIMRCIDEKTTELARAAAIKRLNEELSAIIREGKHSTSQKSKIVANCTCQIW